MARKMICILLVVMLTVLTLPTMAATGNASIYNVIDFKFHHYQLLDKTMTRIQVCLQE